METRRPLVEKAMRLISYGPTRLLTEASLIENDQERVWFNIYYSDFNSLLLELAQYVQPLVSDQINRYLMDIKTPPLARIVNLYQFYIDEFVNQTPDIFTSSHVNLIGYSGSEEVKEATRKILETIKNAHINCINEARRQNLINLSDSMTLVDYLMMAWEGALYQKCSSGSSKSLFVFMSMLRQLLHS